MQFKIEKKELVNALSKVERALGQKELSGIRIMASDILTLSATNREISIEVEINDLDIIEVGEVLLSGKLLSDLIKKTTSPIIHFNYENNQVKIKAGRSNFTMMPLDISKHPNLFEREWNLEIKLEAKKLKSLIKNTVIATSTSNTKPQLAGVNFKIKDKKLYAYATDSFRLAKDYVDIDSKINLDIIIPATSLNELNKILDSEYVAIKLNDFYARFEFNNTIFETKLIAGPYINCERILNGIKLNGEYELNKNMLISSLERANVILDSLTQQIVKIDLAKDLVSISTIQNEVGQVYEEIECKADGIQTQIAVSIKNLLDALKTFEKDAVSIIVSGETSPVIIISPEETSTHLIMPVRM